MQEFITGEELCRRLGVRTGIAHRLVHKGMAKPARYTPCGYARYEWNECRWMWDRFTPQERLLMLGKRALLPQGRSVRA